MARLLKNNCFLLLSISIVLVLAASLFAWGPGNVQAQGGEGGRLEVAVYDDRGVGPCFKAEMAVLKANSDTICTTVLNAEDVREGALSRFDVFMVPGGSGRREAAGLEPAGAEEIKRYVREGGCYVGTCAGCYLASSDSGYLGLLPTPIRDRKHWFRGKAILPIEFTGAGAEVFGVKKPVDNIVYHNGPVLDCRQILEDPQMQENFVPLSFFRGEIVAKGGEVGVMKGAPAMVLVRYGKGLVLGMSPHPEQTPPLHHIIPHALHWLHKHVNTEGPAAEVVRQAIRRSEERRTGSESRARH